MALLPRVRAHDDSKGERFKGLCDKDGCDLNPYRFGVKSFYGNSSSFAIDTTKPFQVVTQWMSDMKEDCGCATTPSPGWVGLLGLLALARRR